MKNINTYIIEKFKISKDIAIDKYSVGDICLSLSFFDKSVKFPSINYNGEGLIFIDIATIVKKEKDDIIYMFLTDLSHIKGKEISMESLQLEESKEKSKYYHYTNSLFCELLLTQEDSIDIINTLSKSNEIDFFKLLGYCPKEFKEYENIEKQYGFVSGLQRLVKRIVLIAKRFRKRL